MHVNKVYVLEWIEILLVKGFMCVEEYVSRQIYSVVIWEFVTDRSNGHYRIDNFSNQDCVYSTMNNVFVGFLTSTVTHIVYVQDSWWAQLCEQCRIQYRCRIPDAAQWCAQYLNSTSHNDTHSVFTPIKTISNGLSQIIMISILQSIF